MVTSQTAVVPVRSLSIVALWTFKSWRGSALPAGAAFAAAGAAAGERAFTACFFDITYNNPPPTTRATARKITIQGPFELDCDSPWAASNIDSSYFLSLVIACTNPGGGGDTPH